MDPAIPTESSMSDWKSPKTSAKRNKRPVKVEKGYCRQFCTATRPPAPVSVDWFPAIETDTDAGKAATLDSDMAWEGVENPEGNGTQAIGSGRAFGKWKIIAAR